MGIFVKCKSIQLLGKKNKKSFPSNEKGGFEEARIPPPCFQFTPRILRS